MSYTAATMSAPRERPICVKLLAIPYASPYFSAPKMAEVIRGGVTVPMASPRPKRKAMM